MSASAPLRLMLVTDAVGGVWVYSLELARGLKPLGVETVLAVMGPSPSAQQREDASDFELTDTGLPLEWLDASPEDIRRGGQVIAEIAERHGIDVVQTSSAALLADAEFSQPCVAVQHSCLASWWEAVRGTPLPPEFAWRRDLVAAGLRNADVVVAPSAAFAAATARIYGVETVPVYNGRRPRIMDLPQGHFAFTASRLWDEGKNAATLDAAAARLASPFQAAGPTSGPNGASVALGHLHLLGEIGPVRMAGLLGSRPVYASAALYEPFGLSVLEAAAAGCALVLSDIATHRELWEGAATLVPATDENAFASAIERLLDDPDEREHLGEKARERARLYSPERMAERMASIYAALTARASPEVASVA